jgi:hypothetical protein
MHCKGGMNSNLSFQRITCNGGHHYQSFVYHTDEGAMHRHEYIGLHDKSTDDWSAKAEQTLARELTPVCNLTEMIS